MPISMRLCTAADALTMRESAEFTGALSASLSSVVMHVLELDGESAPPHGICSLAAYLSY